MKILENIKSKFSKTEKKQNIENSKKNQKENIIEKVTVNYSQKKTRKDILMEVKEEIILKALDDAESSSTLKSDIKKVYDKENVLTSIDIIALECLYKAIRDGNMQVNMSIENKITIFLKKRPNNIVTLIDEMIKDARKIYGNVKVHHEGLDDVESLIANSYYEIMEIIEEIEERQLEEEEKN